MLGMCIQKLAKLFLLLTAFAVFLCGCEAMDDILPSAGTYKINMQINGVLLDECSYITSSDSIHPIFEESVSGDPDVTALIISLKNTNGENFGSRVMYELEKSVSSEHDKSDIDIIQKVKSLDDILPPYPLPKDMSPGVYTIVSQIMSGKNILQRTEKSIFYLGVIDFKYGGIDIHLPGIVENSHLIPVDTVIMLEAGIEYSGRLNPYIIWYEGRKRIGEGYISDGAGNRFWKTPEQSGIFTLSAEIFPVRNYDKLPGYKKEISLIVSSISTDVHLISENIPQLINWYKLEGNLNDSKSPSAERALQPAGINKLKWAGSGGTYGIITGNNNVFALPKVVFPGEAVKIWQTLFRFKPVSDGCLFTVQFGASGVFLSLFQESSAFILTLMSPDSSTSQIIYIPAVTDDLPDTAVEKKTAPFLTAGINITVLPGIVSAQLNILGDNFDSSAKSIALEVNVDDEFQILLGFQPEINSSDSAAETRSEAAALWDEFALYYKPPRDILITELAHKISEDQTPDDSTIN